VFGHDSSGLASLIPGYWDHVGMIVGWSDYYNDWLVVEAEPSTGVHVTTFSTFLTRYETVAIERVAVSDAIKEAAVQFALAQVGKSYNWDFFSKPKVYDDKYYCSQLVWAAYMAASNGQVNLDPNPSWSWEYGYAVAPTEVYDSNWTYVVYYNGI